MGFYGRCLLDDEYFLTFSDVSPFLIDGISAVLSGQNRPENTHHPVQWES